MSSIASSTLSWSAVHQVYELSAGQCRELMPLPSEGPAWSSWLDAVSSFAFHGQCGSYTARKETKQRGAVYWYAYRKTQGKLIKKYLGKSTDLTLARLEDVASLLPPDRATTARTLHLVPALPACSETARPLVTEAASVMDVRAPLPPLTPPDTPVDPLTFLRTTKLHPPRPRAQLVPRSHLVERLQQGGAGALTLLSAPAGYGKTTLLAQWLSQSRMPVAWLSLEPADDEPVLFLTYVIAALQTLDPQIGTTTLALLYSPQPPPLERALALLTNDLAVRLAEESTLVLDNYQVLTSAPIHRAVSTLAEYGPPQLHLAIATRTDPPLPLARLRAQGKLTELRAIQLQFSPEESTNFLHTVMGLDLPPEDMTTLERRLEGWIAGLQLVGLSLQGRPDRQQFLADFSGSHRYIVDYLVEEVLSHQSEALQAFLLHTSILDHLTGPLCNAVTGRSDGAAMLEHLERANLFLVPLDEQRQWYHYHQLFAGMLRARLLHMLGKAGLGELYGRASEWYERNGFSAEAVETALDAVDFERAAVLITDIAVSMLVQYRQATLLGWLEQVPRDFLLTQAPLALAYGSALSLANQPAAQEQLGVAERLFRAEGNRHGLGKVFAVQAITACPRGDAVQAIAYGHQALELLPEEDLSGNLFYRCLILGAIGIGERLTGNVRVAWQTLTKASELNQRAGNPNCILGDTLQLGVLLAMQGKLHEALATYQQVIASAGGRLRWTVEALIETGALFLEWNELDVAEQQLHQAIALARQIGDDLLMPLGCLGLARVMQARGEAAQATELFAQAVAQAQRSGQPRVIAQAQAAQVRWWLMREEMEAVWRWQAAGVWMGDEAPTYEREPTMLALARVLITQGEAAEALRLLDDFLAHARTQGRLASELELLVLSAIAYQAQGKPEQAVQLLQQALILAEPAGYLRLFVDEGPAMTRLLHLIQPRWQGQRGAAYVRRLLVVLDAAYPAQTVGVFAPQQTRPLAPLKPLSGRECKVLSFLELGLSNPEMAAELGVSLNTVKTQTSSIYRKLNVPNRKAAIATARYWHLLYR